MNWIACAIFFCAAAYCDAHSMDKPAVVYFTFGVMALFFAENKATRITIVNQATQKDEEQ